MKKSNIKMPATLVRTWSENKSKLVSIEAMQVYER